MKATFWSDRTVPVPVDLAHVQRLRAIHQKALAEDWVIGDLIAAILETGHVPVFNFKRLKR